MLWRDPHPYPRTWWSETWRIGIALLSGVVFLGMVMGDQQGPSFERSDALVALDIALGIVALLCVPLRRRFPLPVALATSVLTLGSAAASPAAGLATVSLATHRSWPPIVITGIVEITTGMLYEHTITPDSMRLPWWVNLVLATAFYVTAVAIGLSIGARRDLVVSLHERAETAEREQAGRVLAARSAERARIAREMHDLLAHRISLVAMHAGALTYRDDLTREETRAAAEVIRDNAHKALGELREVLGVLRSAADDALDATAAEPPQPALTNLPMLLDEERRVGARVDAALDADLAAVPTTVSRNAYRILTEALTNARKHAPGQPVTVHLSGSARVGLTLRVANSMPATLPRPEPLAPGVPPSLGSTAPSGVPGAGLGLLGVRERAQLTGGRLSYGPDGAGRFVVEAWLPWAREEQSAPAGAPLGMVGMVGMVGMAGMAQSEVVGREETPATPSAPDPRRTPDSRSEAHDG